MAVKSIYFPPPRNIIVPLCRPSQRCEVVLLLSLS